MTHSRGFDRPLSPGPSTERRGRPRKSSGMLRIGELGGGGEGGAGGRATSAEEDRRLRERLERRQVCPDVGFNNLETLIPQTLKS
jgi:hypothetical protein